MENQALIAQCEKVAQSWMNSACYDAETQKAVKAMVENPDKTELIDSFYRTLEFGTGGLRGIMGPGTNRMNIYTVGAATQGLSNYPSSLPLLQFSLERQPQRRHSIWGNPCDLALQCRT